MELNKKTVDDINVKGKRVLCRCDFNVPIISGKITDENRLVAALPTIKKLIADGGKVILCSHLGKVKTEEDKLTKTLAPVAVRLSELLGQEVKFVADPEVVGKNVRAAVAAMKEFMSNLDMDNLPKAINLRLEITEPTKTAKRYVVVEVLDERDFPCCFEE